MKMRNSVNTLDESPGEDFKTFAFLRKGSGLGLQETTTAIMSKQFIKPQARSYANEMLIH